MADKELTQFIRDVVESLKHCETLGIKVIEAELSRLKLLLPYDEKIVGNPETGVIHGGALTTLLDTACGFAAVCALDEFAIAPTLDLRIDYMRPATPNKAVVADATAYHVTQNVIFARAVAFHEGEKDRPIAQCTASFMRLDPQTHNTPKATA